jgi:hypothetical protein
MPPGRLAVLAQQLREAGLIVTQVLDATGVIVGHAEEASIPGLPRGARRHGDRRRAPLFSSASRQ